MSRPRVLFPLFATLETLPGVGPRTVEALAALDVTRPRDLLFLLPQGGIDRTERTSLEDVTPPAVATVEVRVGRHVPPHQKGQPYRIEVSDSRLHWTLIFFHAREMHLRAILPEGARRVVSGKVELFDGRLQMIHPDHVLPPEERGTLPTFEPLYPLAARLTQRMVRKAVLGALARAPDLAEWIDGPLRAQKSWPGWQEALRLAHAPEGPADLQSESPARMRLAYDELFAHQLTLALARNSRRRARGLASRGDGRLRRRVIDALPWALTAAQKRALDEIAADMAAPWRMNRLLQGDVGSGKTLVAFLALLIAVEAGGQGVLMVPTEILARQHHAGIAAFATAAGVRVTLLTGRDRGQERAAKLAALAGGDTDILIGTHAVFQKDVAFAALRLVVIDEQHRFGVAQRMELAEKGIAADVLVMTATPIPRSLALANYGDMELSVLDEKPPGRVPVRTALVSEARMDEVVARLRRAIDAGRQAYWVCPLVEESEVVDFASAEERFRSLSAALGAGRVGLVHGRMSDDDKDAAMARFVAGEVPVLVATTVIEVGVDVPGASIIVIEQAERFGLAQLHQLRGRVGRGGTPSTCLLLYRPPLSRTARRRLMAIRDSDDGFRIAEEDLAIRGAGDLIGTAQSGLPRFRIADLERQVGLMTTAQRDARRLLEEDPTLATPRGRAARTLLWLLEQERAIRLLGVG